MTVEPMFVTLPLQILTNHQLILLNKEHSGAAALLQDDKVGKFVLVTKCRCVESWLFMQVYPDFAPHTTKAVVLSQDQLSRQPFVTGFVRTWYSLSQEQ